MLATILNLQVPDMLKCVGESLLPIFGIVTVFRYPDFPLALAVEGGRTNLITVGPRCADDSLRQANEEPSSSHGVLCLKEPSLNSSITSGR